MLLIIQALDFELGISIQEAKRRLIVKELQNNYDMSNVD